ncbi:MAG: pitrilysin family protein [Candidatus Berkelbacteria bacterium]|nr:pitrilysin family protein [Candidatus Berkelbacteria bacterium]
MYKKFVLSNNFRIITVPMKETKAVILYLIVKVGSRYEQKEKSGISHFLEHLFFKGTKKRPSTFIISKELDGIGASYNAFTSEEITGFYIQAEASKFNLICDVLFDILSNSLFDAKEIEKEKGVIAEEYNMRRDAPMSYIFDLYKQLLFKDTPLGRLVIGEPEVIKELKRDDFLTYKNQYYLPSRTVLGLAGSLKNENLNLVKNYAAKIKDNISTGALPAAYTQKIPEVLVFPKKTDQTHLIIGFRSVSRRSKERYIQEVLNVILGASMSSRLFIEVREKSGLAYHISSDTWYFDDTGSLIAYAGVPIAKTKEAIKLILSEFNKIRDRGVTEEELKKAKDYLKGKMALRLESSYNRAAYIADQELLLDEIKTPNEELEEYEKVTKKDIIRFAKKVLQRNKLNLALIGPFEKKEEFIKILD